MLLRLGHSYPVSVTMLKREGGVDFGVWGAAFPSVPFGRKFTLVTDHRLLMTILGPKEGIPSLAAARLQRVFLLSGYHYEIEFRSTHADVLSRLPLNVKDSKNGSEATLFNIYQIETLPVTSTEIQRATRRDPVRSQMLHFTQNGWPVHVFGQLKTFHAK